MQPRYVVLLQMYYTRDDNLRILRGPATKVESVTVNQKYHLCILRR